MRSSNSIVNSEGLNVGNSKAIATLYLAGPLGHLSLFALSLTVESNPDDRTAPNHSPSTKPKSIAVGSCVVTKSSCFSISSSDHLRALTKSFPVPAGMTAKGVLLGTTACKIKCASPSPPTEITPGHCR